MGNVGNAHFQNYTAVGDTINVAARIQAAAAPGEILCSDAARRSAGEGLLWSELGLMDMKGRREPVRVFRIEGLHGGE